MSDDGHRYSFGPPKGGWSYKGKGRAVSETYITDDEHATPAHGHRAYVCGPMRGKPGNNFTAFDTAAVQLRSRGWSVINPADLDREEGVGSEDLPLGSDASAFLRRDIAAIVTCTDVVLLPGWEVSVGARVECIVGLAIGVTFWLIGPHGGLRKVSRGYVDIVVDPRG